MKKLLLLAGLIFLHGCESHSHYYQKSYGIINSNLQKKYNLRNGDLILTYNLAKVRKSNCIYDEDLGIIINNKKYTDIYIKEFDNHYKSPAQIKKEALKKVFNIANLLLKLHNKYFILTNNQYQYVKSLGHTKRGAIDAKKELAKLNAIIAFIPLLLPEHKALISSHYGNRLHPTHKVMKFHCGTDLISHSSGAPIFAAASGKVVFAGRKNGHGLTIEVRHHNKIITKYSHLDRIDVRKNQQVVRGMIIGKQGATGNATGSHLHFEIWVNGRHVNPIDFIGDACKCQRS